MVDLELVGILGAVQNDLMEEILEEDVKPNLIFYSFPVDHNIKFLVQTV